MGSVGFQDDANGGAVSTRWAVGRVDFIRRAAGRLDISITMFHLFQYGSLPFHRPLPTSLGVLAWARCIEAAEIFE